LSTILKALKKLEHEMPLESDGLTGVRKSSPRETLGRRAERFMRFHKSFWLFAGLGALAVAAGIIYLPSYSDPGKSVSTRKLDQPAKITPKTASARQPGKQNQVPAQIKKLLTDLPLPVSRLPEKSAKKKVSRKPAPSVKRTKTLKSGQSRLPPKVLDSRSGSVQLLEDSKLKLQAISWSQNPDNRIAVINGVIMREGESIEGYRINRIGQDDVLVGSGQDERKLVFGFK
jgi:hypothetical protein